MRKQNITLEILVNGNSVSEYSKDGNRYIEGRKGNEYTLRVKNHTGSRVLVVPTIDGLSVMDGKPGNYDSSGYILDAGGKIDIDGWRTDLQNVRKFQFVKHQKSYSAKSGQGEDNLGVIGVAAFYGAPKVYYTLPLRGGCFGEPTWGDFETFQNFSETPTYGMGIGISSSGAIGTSVNTVNLMHNSLNTEPTKQLKATVGTGMGNKIHSAVREVSFERQPLPFAEISLYYYEKRQLEQMGIIHKVNKKKDMPQPFPNNFCLEV